jgi:hypothetical protein
VTKPASFIFSFGLAAALLVFSTTLARAANESQVTQVGGGRQRLSAGEIAKRATSTVVTITTPSGTGSGVLVDSDGTLVTNLHVVRGDTRVSVRLANGDAYDDVHVVDVDARKDLVVLRIKAYGLTPATLGNSDQVNAGDRVFLLGSPRGLQNTLSDGLISALRDSGEGFRLFQTTAPASPGSSGGGMFNEFGELVGILVGKRADAENVNFAVPINYARGLLATKTVTTLVDLARKYPAENQASDAAAASVNDANKKQLLERLQRLLNESGLKVEKADDGWKVRFTGTNAAKVSVDISVFEDLALIQSGTITSRTLTPSEMTALLEQNFQQDFAKVGLVKNQLIASTETEIRTLDARLLRRLIEGIASVADETFGILSAPAAETMTYPSLIGPSRLMRTETIDINRGSASLRYEGHAWKRFGPSEDLQHRHTSGDAFFRVIAERVQIPIEKLEDVALTNAKNADPNARVVKRGWRLVNGQRLLVLEIDLTVQNVPFVFYGHYYSGSIGTIQIVGWTGKNLLEEYRVAIDAVVSGFQVGR